MFCQKCWHEFRDKGSTCIYCGAPKPVDEWELDWEEAARLREAQEDVVRELASRLASVSHPARKSADDCIRPNDLSNHCVSCGKEIPSSARAKICANCAASKERKKTEVQKEKATKEKALRRAKASQDNSIRPNDSPLSCVVCGKALPTSARSNVCAVCASRGARREDPPAIQQAAPVPAYAAGAPAYAATGARRSKFSGLSVAALTIVILSIIFGPSLFNIIQAFGTYSNSPVEIVSESAILMSESDLVEIYEYDTQTLESSSESDSYIYYTFLDAQARPPLDEADSKAIYTDYILPASDEMLNYIIPLIFDDNSYFISIDSSAGQTFEMDGIYYLHGNITYYHSADAQEYTEPFMIGWILYNQEEAAFSYLEMTGDVIFGSMEPA